MDVDDRKSGPMELSEAQLDRISELEDWLAHAPEAWAKAISVRIALRVLPLCGAATTFVDVLDDGYDHNFLTAFRISFTLWAEQIYGLSRSEEVARDFAEFAFDLDHTDVNASNVIASAASAGASPIIVTDILEIIVQASNVAGDAVMTTRTKTTRYEAREQILDSILTDARWLNTIGMRKVVPETSARELMAEPLWMNEVRGETSFRANFPPWVREPFDAFANSEIVVDGAWSPWVVWYRAILPNGPDAKPASAFGVNIDIDLATRPRSFWLRNSEIIMEDISALLRGETLPESSETHEVEGISALLARETHPESSEIQTEETGLAFLSDAHDPTIDYLGRAQLAFVLAGRLNQIWDDMNPDAVEALDTDGAPAGFVVHIDAPWGGGKTSFASFLTRILNPYRPAGDWPDWLDKLPLDDEVFWPKEYRRPWHVVNFNAWQHQHVKPPWWVFYDAIRRQCRDGVARATSQQSENRFVRLFRFSYQNGLVRKLWGVPDWIREAFWRLWTPYFRNSLSITLIGVLVLSLLFFFDVIQFGDEGVQMGLALTSSEATADGVQSLLPTVLILLLGVAPTIWTSVSAMTRTLFPGTPKAAANYSLGAGDPLDRFRKHFARMAWRFKRPIVVVVDDLDRCEPNYVVELLSGMQTILASPRIIFILLGDQDWIEQAFSEVHKSMKGIDVGPEHEFGGRFVEKAIQFSFVLPEVSADTRHAYVRSLLNLADEKDEGNDSPTGAQREWDMELENQTRAVLAEDDYGKREAAATTVLENIESQKLGDEEFEVTKREFDTQLSLRAAADSSAQRATSHMVEALSPVLPANPRQIKRIVNAISLMQEAARLEGYAKPGSSEWQVMARWIVLMIEWPKSWFTLSRYPLLADILVSQGEETLSERPGDSDVLVKLLETNEEVKALLTFADAQRGWARRDITSAEIAWLRQLIPPTSGRLLNSGDDQTAA